MRKRSEPEPLMEPEPTMGDKYRSRSGAGAVFLKAHVGAGAEKAFLDRSQSGAGVEKDQSCPALRLTMISLIWHYAK